MGVEDKQDDALLVCTLIEACRKEFAKAVVGQNALFDAMMCALMAGTSVENGRNNIGGSHILLEGLPGLAKTTAAKTFAAITGLSFRRVQFTPDLLPQDITGTLVYEQTTGKFIARKGPIFANVVLADEINRAGAKVQSALLEAMQERQVTLGNATLTLPNPFLVIATENPIDEDGTYSLPIAERDRFLMKEVVPYPTVEEECAIISKGSAALKQDADALDAADALTATNAVLNNEKVSLLQSALQKVTCDDKLIRYIVNIVRATRPDSEAAGSFDSSDRALRSGTGGVSSAFYNAKKDILRYVEVGSSPRGSIALLLCAKAKALMAGRAFVLPDDIKALAPAVLRHRLCLSYEASSDGVAADTIIGIILAAVNVP